MFISAKHISKTKGQDFSGFSLEHPKTMIICDGVGSYSHSEHYSQNLVASFLKSKDLFFNKEKYSEAAKQIFDFKESGGTTYLSVILNELHPERLSTIAEIYFCGNGGIIHLHGDFAQVTIDNTPYVYSNIIVPHISPSRGLTKHFSKGGNSYTLKPTKITLTLNYHAGDILLFFSDGICSLEDNGIIQDSDGRFWRSEVSAVQVILKGLDALLREFSKKENSIFQEELEKFNDEILLTLKDQEYLEDDASLGIIISPEVLSQY